eukprot:1161743-Pelagomonas_calceolata.AAC.11
MLILFDRINSAASALTPQTCADWCRTCMCKKFDCGCPYVPHCRMSPQRENSLRIRGTSACVGEDRHRQQSWMGGKDVMISSAPGENARICCFKTLI